MAYCHVFFAGMSVYLEYNISSAAAKIGRVLIGSIMSSIYPLCAAAIGLEL